MVSLGGREMTSRQGPPVGSRCPFLLPGEFLVVYGMAGWHVESGHATPPLPRSVSLIFDAFGVEEKGE